MSFKQDLEMGEKWERKLIQYFQQKGWQAFKLDHNFHSADIVLIDKKKKVTVIEVKAHRNYKRYPTFPAEVWMNSKKQLPEYLRPDCQANYIFQVDVCTGQVFVFQRSELAEYILDRKDQARRFYQQSSGILIDWKCKEAGFKTTFYLGGR